MSRSPLPQGDVSLLPITAKLRARWVWIVAFLLLVAAAELAGAAATHRIVQKGRAFGVGEITINRGDTLLFTNEDEFLHQIYVASGGMTFDSNEQAPGQTIDVHFPSSGTFAVRCHIHPKMLLTVRVQ
jgi:plastocyanin